MLSPGITSPVVTNSLIKAKSKNSTITIVGSSSSSSTGATWSTISSVAVFTSPPASFVLLSSGVESWSLLIPSSEISAWKTNAFADELGSKTTCNVNITMLSGAKPPTGKRPFPTDNKI